MHYENKTVFGECLMKLPNEVNSKCFERMNKINQKKFTSWQNN